MGRVRTVALTSTVVAAAIAVAYSAVLLWPSGDGADPARIPATGSASPTPAPPQTVALAFFDDLTGKGFKTTAQPALNAVTMAVADYNNSKPATRVELVTLGAAQPWHLVVAGQTGRNVVAVVGPFTTSGSKEALPVLEASGIPSITVSASDSSLRDLGLHHWHRLIADDDEQIGRLASYLTRTLHPRKVYTVDYGGDDTAYFAGQLATKMKAAGAKETVQDRIAKGGADIPAIVSRIKNYRPDVIIHFGQGADVAALAKRLRKAGVTTPFATGENVLLDPDFRTAGGYATSGTLIAGSFLLTTPEADPALAQFTSRYQQRFGQAPGPYAAEAYDATTAFLQAIQSGKTNADDINTYLSTEKFTGMSRTVQFQPTGENRDTPVYVYKVTSGRLALLGEASTTA